LCSGTSPAARAASLFGLYSISIDINPELQNLNSFFVEKTHLFSKV